MVRKMKSITITLTEEAAKAISVMLDIAYNSKIAYLDEEEDDEEVRNDLKEAYRIAREAIQ